MREGPSCSAWGLSWGHPTHCPASAAWGLSSVLPSVLPGRKLQARQLRPTCPEAAAPEGEKSLP